MLAQQKAKMLHLWKLQKLPNVMRYFASLWCDQQINYLRWKFLFHFWNNGPNWYQDQHPYENPLECKCFTKIVASKYVKVSIVNGREQAQRTE